MNKAETTRLSILEKAFQLIYEKGYQTTSIDDILAKTQVTKGAFYYHFKNKDEMGIAIVNDLMKPALTNSFSQLQKNPDPLDGIYQLMHHLLLKNEFLKVSHGCPAANLTHEMTPWNAAFSATLQEITEQWMKMMTAAITKGKTKGVVRKDVNASQVALFVMSGYWGIRNFGKLENDTKPYMAYLKELKQYLQTLK